MAKDPETPASPDASNVPDELDLERATDDAAVALKALAGFSDALKKLSADLGLPEQPDVPDASPAIREAAATLQLIGETVAERGPSEASKLLEAAGTAEEIRAAAERLRAATRAIRGESAE
jgi:hypothetical protein